MHIGYLGTLLAHSLSFQRPILARLQELEACLFPGLCVYLGVRAPAFSRRESASVPHSRTVSWVDNPCRDRSRSRGIARARRAPSESCLAHRGLCGTPLCTLERERFPHSACQGTVLPTAISLMER